MLAGWWGALQGASSMEFVYDPATKSGTVDVPWYEGNYIRYHYVLQGQSFKLQLLDGKGSVIDEFSSELDQEVPPTQETGS